ncbi:MAG TPA: hypothetical protein VF064_13040, partial [Pyrinomonadaceae bacterium]
MTTPQQQQTNAFAGLAPNAETHFRLYYYAAVSRLLGYMQRLGGAGGAAREGYQFLQGYEDELRAAMPGGGGEEEARAWWRAEIGAWEQETRARLPLRELAKTLGLSHGELIALVLAGVVEEDIRFGSVFAALQEPLPARRPCLGLLGALAGGDEERGGGDWWSAARRLMDAGLIVAENRAAPRSEWVMRVEPHVWDAVRGRDLGRISAECSLVSRREFMPLKKLALDEDLRRRLAGIPAVVARGQLGAVVLRGMADSGRRAVMGALARATRRDLLFYDRRGAPPSPADDLW